MRGKEKKEGEEEEEERLGGRQKRRERERQEHAGLISSFPYLAGGPPRTIDEGKRQTASFRKHEYPSGKETLSVRLKIRNLCMSIYVLIWRVEM